MDVHVVVLVAEFTKESHWFIQIELEQQSYPSKLKTKQKQRTDMSFGFSPKFEKNKFVFKASLSNRLTLKLGAISMANATNKGNIDPSKCICQGMYTLVITKRMLSALRDQVPLKENYVLHHPSSREETANLSIALSLNFDGIEEKIIEDERVFMKIEYDRYETDKEIIRDKEEKVIRMLEGKSKELNEWMKKVEHIKNALRSLGADTSMLKKEKDLLEYENKEIAKTIERLSRVDDIHIKVDMLSTSPHGVEILKLMLEKTDIRLRLQRKIYDDLTENWMKIEGKKRKFELLKEEVNKVKEAQSQLEFHMLTLKDQLPQALILRENVRSLDNLIKDFERQIAKGRAMKKDKGSEAEILNLKHKHAILQEKQKQVQIILDSNNGFAPIEELEKIHFEEYNEDPESQILKDRGEELLKEIEELGQQFSRENFVPKSRGNTIELEVKLQAAQARVDAMQMRMTEHTAAHAKEIAMYESQIALLDAQLVKTRF